MGSPWVGRLLLASLSTQCAPWRASTSPPLTTTPPRQTWMTASTSSLVTAPRPCPMVSLFAPWSPPAATPLSLRRRSRSSLAALTSPSCLRASVSLSRSTEAPLRCPQWRDTSSRVSRATSLPSSSSKSKDNVMILKSSKISVFFDGKRVKLEGSNLLKNKLCGLCGDNNNKKIGDVPSPRQCLLSKPKLEVASYRVSLPSKQCSPLPGHLRAELERETARCIRFSHKPTGGISSAYRQSESLYSSGECTKIHHEIVDKYAKNELCFSMIPIVECGSSCHPSATELRMNVGFTCMSKSDRRTQRIAEKIRNGEVITHELMHFPISYTTVRRCPSSASPTPCTAEVTAA